MVILIGGATHTGKTALAQKLLEKHHYPYLSVDHLKMGLIRSGQTDLTPMDDDKLTAYLWPIVREMVKTAIENDQNLVVEGCYIPFDWRRDFEAEYLEEIRCRFLVMTRDYIEAHFDDIKEYACTIENRMDDSFLMAEQLMVENAYNLSQCIANGCPYILIDSAYEVDLSWTE
ncbi:MAG: adenylate kinase [Oscillospiraceae bacterium]|nr:adenylate kinase [Oscillospiraceae bacterium]